MSDDKNDAADFLMEMCETQGAAASTVKDGHIILFKRKFLQAMLDKNPTQEKLMIFIKRPDFKD